MLILGFGVLLCGMVIAQAAPEASASQSLKIHQTVDPIYPHELLQLGVTEGEVRLAINTDPTGRLTDLLVVGFTQPEFADSAARAVKQWRFEPARLQGEAVGTTIELDFHFETQGTVVVSQNVSDYLRGRMMRMMQDRFAYRPHGAQELDRIPALTATVMPAYSKQLASQGVIGTVKVEFYIDETGAVRLPAVSAEDNSILCSLAVTALTQWKFAPPTSRGKAVLVKASQEFRFGNGS
jgi:TonB family protein